MDQEDFNNLIKGLEDVRDFQSGKRESFVIHTPASVPETVDVRAIRKAEGLTQEEFAKRYGFTKGAIRDWEQRRRQPERSARILLTLIAREPETVRRVIQTMS